jgi:hypothetical protein
MFSILAMSGSIFHKYPSLFLQPVNLIKKCPLHKIAFPAKSLLRPLYAKKIISRCATR